MRKTYNKLVRDQIPEIIRLEGRKCATQVMEADEYRHALLEKLVEEANEVAMATPDTVKTELADLLEVVDTLLKMFEFSLEDIELIQTELRLKRGGFQKKLKLLWTE